MKLIIVAFLLCSAYLLSSCKSQKTPDTSEDLRIYFGSGGGFTGFVTEYCLLKNGSIFSKKTNDPEWSYHSKLDKRSTQQYFQQIGSSQLFETQFNHPSNRYFFIRVKDQEKENKIIWGDTSKRPDKKITVLYSILNSHIAQKNTNDN